MKLKTEDSVILQKYDVAFLMGTLNSVPGSIVSEILSDSSDRFSFLNGSADRFRFENVFKNPINVEWLMKQDWIVDYEEYIKIPLSNLEMFTQRLGIELAADIHRFNAMDEDYRREHINEESVKFEKSGHKISSLEALVGFRKGDIKFVFPDEYHDVRVRDSVLTEKIIRIPSETYNSTRHSEGSATRKKPGLFSRLFGHKG